MVVSRCYQQGLASVDVGGQIIEFLKLSNPDGYYLMCEYLLKGV